MKYSGLILADLAGGEVIREGGFLGVGVRERKREDFTVDKALQRIAYALEKLAIQHVAYLWMGEQQVFESGDGETKPLVEIMDEHWSALAAARDENDLSLMLLYEDDDFSHTLVVTYAVEHDPSRPGLVVDDAAFVREFGRLEDEGAEAYQERVDEIWDDEDAVPDYEDALEEFLNRLADELRKELAFSDVDVYVELQSGERYPELGLRPPETGNAAASFGRYA